MKKLFILIICPILILIGAFVYSNLNKPHAQSQAMVYTEQKQDSDSDVIVLKIAHSFEIPHPQYMAITDKFIPMVTQGSNWKIRVEVYPNNSLGNVEQVIQGVRKGTIEMCLGGEALSKTIPKMKMLEIPYLFRDYEEVKATINGDFGRRISQELNSIGLKDLAWSLNGFRQISVYREENGNEKDRPKLASTYSDINRLPLESIGYDVFPADEDQTTMVLSQGLVVGHDNPPVLSYYNGWYDNVKKIFVTKHSISPTVYIINNKFWSNLTEEHKRLIQNAAQAAANYEIELLKNTEDDIFDTLKKRGVKIEYPDLSQNKNIDMKKFAEWMKNNSELEEIYINYLNERKN